MQLGAPRSPSEMRAVDRERSVGKPTAPSRFFVENLADLRMCMRFREEQDDNVTTSQASTAMAQPALDVFRSLDQALAAAVTSAAPSVVHVARGRGGGTGIAWTADLVISSSFHTPDR